MFKSIKNIFNKLQRVGKTYILPTRYGLYFLLFVFVLFLFSLTYGHSMAFTATFLFVCLLMTSAAVTNYNLKYITMSFPITKVSTFCEQSIDVILNLKSAYERGSVWVQGEVETNFNFHQSQTVELKAHTKAETSISFIARKRGIYSLKQWSLRTCYPMGLFMAWKPLEQSLSVRVLPKPIDYNIVPQFIEALDSSHEQFVVTKKNNEEDFYEYKVHEEGDSWKLIDWKILAKADIYLKKSFLSEKKNGHFFFDYESLIDLNHEQRLSQLVFWILQAVESRNDFVVGIPGLKFQMYNPDSDFDPLWDQIATLERPH